MSKIKVAIGKTESSLSSCILKKGLEESPSPGLRLKAKVASFILFKVLRR